MEMKKNPEKDVHRKRPLFFGIALIVTMALVLSAFNFKTSVGSDFSDMQVEMFVEDEIIPPTVQPPEEVPKPEPVSNPIFKEVKDHEEVPEVELNMDFALEEEIPEVEYVEEEQDEVVEDILMNELLEKKAEYRKGGLKGFYRFVRKKLKYPSQARRQGLQGKVIVAFVIDKDGSLSDISVLKGIGAGCDEEAVRVLTLSPKWKPAKQRGRPVKVKMIIPIHFKLN